MAKDQLAKSKHRGTSDELEIMQEIIKNDPILLDRVLTKIRSIRDAPPSRDLADIIAEKRNLKREGDPRKR